MDPDPEPSLHSSSTPKTLFLTLVFSTFYCADSFHPPPKDRFFISHATAKFSSALPETKKLPSKKKIYLTFDDGPNKGTRNVMRIIEQERINATLFVVGQHVYGSKMQSSIYDSAARKTIFEIANHSFTHAHQNKYRSFYQLPDSVVKDFVRCADSLQLRSNIIRTPGRNTWRTATLRSIDIHSSTEAVDLLYQFGFQAIGWDLEWHFDAAQRLVQTDEELANEVDSAFSQRKTKITDHLVLLAHDQAFVHSSDSNSLHLFIRRLKSKEQFEFEQISKYPGLSPNGQRL